MSEVPFFIWGLKALAVMIMSYLTFSVIATITISAIKQNRLKKMRERRYKNFLANAPKGK